MYYNTVPTYYDGINEYNGQQNPSTVHAKNTDLERFFERYLLQKVFSVFEFDLPEDWNRDYFFKCLFINGFIGVFNTDRWGIVCQHGSPFGYDIYYQPTNILYANPRIEPTTQECEIGINTEVIKLKNSWTGIMDIVSLYATMMALCCESAGINLINSKLAYVFMGEGKTENKTFMKMFDKLNSGDPAVFMDRKLFDAEGNPKWQLFNQNLKQTYIAHDIMADLKSWESEFNTLIGIPNVNFEKRERLLTNEVDSNNADTQALSLLWLENLQKSIEKVNDMFGLSISVKLRFDEEFEAKEDNTDIGKEVNFNVE